MSQNYAVKVAMNFHGFPGVNYSKWVFTTRGEKEKKIGQECYLKE